MDINGLFGILHRQARYREMVCFTKRCRMNQEDSNILMDMLISDEGYRKFKYQCTEGFWTIGIGFNIDAGMDLELAKIIAKYFIDKREAELTKALPWFSELDDNRKLALLNMAFQLGTEGLLKFKRTLEAIRQGKYKEASEYMLDSLWAKQTPPRARRMAKIIETGLLP